ncbi:AzlD family protein [Rhizobium alvei]|uniref:AzlD domain-containing protein n=1 Tax=Rhizobium alvei TaxID=1132659 RepID=A0ABT8YIH1_9HYPH|nr:AzlD domain-containing protein [Rhizobium alvei]MDO6963493.1 AzlD domain-containing protein [Rhizobium alvei]
MDPVQTLTILAAALATYATRVGGYLLIKSMKTIPPRMEAALNAVPAAVLASLVAPSFVYGGLDVTVTLIVALIIGLRAHSLVMLVASWAFVIAFRHFSGL